jgi:membrane dipeptidase
MDQSYAAAGLPLTIDMHADTPQRFLDEGWDFTGPLGAGMINLETARRGGLAAESFAIWVEPTEHAGNYAARAMALLQATLDQVKRHPEELQLCVTAGDIIEAHAAGRFGVLLGVEGGHAIEASLDRLREFHRLGVRSMTLTWNNNNEWADASNDVERHGGLTEFGREVIREMNRLGMMVDLSHASDKTFGDVLEVSAAPAIASHSNARALTQVRRNLTDEQLKALAERGGVAMVNFFPAFVDNAWNLAWDRTRPQRKARHEEAARPYREAGRPVPYHVSNGVDCQFAAQMERTPFESLMAHFDYMLRVAGTEHVGIGTDFDGIPGLPEGIDSAADLPRVADALAGKGYSGEEVAKVLGGNVLRVFGDVQRCAAEIASASGRTNV